MKTYPKLFIKTSMLFISALTLTNSLWAEATSGSMTPDLVTKDKIRVCVNFDILNSKSLDLLIKQTKPEVNPDTKLENNFKDVSFTLTQSDNCMDIKLEDIPSTPNSSTEHVIMEKQVEKTAGGDVQTQIFSRISIPDIKKHGGCEIQISFSTPSTGYAQSISGGEIKNCHGTTESPH